MRARNRSAATNPGKRTHVEASEAARLLGISRASLYVYVSRGLVRSVPDPSNGKSCLYATADIRDLQARKKLARRPRVAAATALDHGLPVLQTSITRIEGNHCYYRSMEAVAFSRQATLEDAARLLWATPADDDPFTGMQFDPGRIAGWQASARMSSTWRATDRAMLLLSLVAPLEARRFGRPGPEAFRDAARVVAALAAALSGSSSPITGPIHRAVSVAWHRPKAADVVRRALVLLADHELNASAFAVRVVASTGTSLTGSTLSGLAAMSGPRHGGATESLRSLLGEIETVGDAGRVVEERLGRGETIPGFGKSVYRDQDPRGVELASAVKLDRTMTSLLRCARALTGEGPNVDFGLLAVERAHDLPAGAALALFALGRSVGWIAHAFEQRASGKLIRPRAEFVPEPP